MGGHPMPLNTPNDNAQACIDALKLAKTLFTSDTGEPPAKYGPRQWWKKDLEWMCKFVCAQVRPDCVAYSYSQREYSQPLHCWLKGNMHKATDSVWKEFIMSSFAVQGQDHALQALHTKCEDKPCTTLYDSETCKSTYKAIDNSPCCMWSTQPMCHLKASSRCAMAGISTTNCAWSLDPFTCLDTGSNLYKNCCDWNVWDYSAVDETSEVDCLEKEIECSCRGGWGKVGEPCAAADATTGRDLCDRCDTDAGFNLPSGAEECTK
eukprot:g9133.t1